MLQSVTCCQYVWLPLEGRLYKDNGAQAVIDEKTTLNRLLELLIVLIIYALPILDILDCMHVDNPTAKC